MNPTKYPTEAKLQLEKIVEGSWVNSIKYRRVIESLRYLTRTRLDLSYVVGMMSRYMEKPTMMQHGVIKHILRYVKQTTCYGLKYQRGRDPKTN